MFILTDLGHDVDEGHAYLFTITPKLALATSSVITWDVISLGRVPALAQDFPSLSGEISFTAGEAGGKTIRIPLTQDHNREAPEHFAINLRAKNGDETDEILLHHHLVTIQDDDEVSAVTARFVSGGSDSDLVMIGAGPVAGTVTGAAGDDLIVISRFVSDDITIEDVSGETLIKFDIGSAITGVVEETLSLTPAFSLHLHSVISLGTGADITIQSPTTYRYQLGDGVVMSYQSLVAELAKSGYQSGTSGAFQGTYHVIDSLSRAEEALAQDTGFTIAAPDGTSLARQVQEGGSYQFTITSTHALTSDVSLSWQVAGIGAHPIHNADVSTTSGMVTFTNGSAAGASQTITISFSDNTVHAFPKTAGLTITKHLNDSQQEVILNQFEITFNDNDKAQSVAGGWSGTLYDDQILLGSYGISGEISGLAGDDQFVITRVLREDVTLSDSDGHGLVKLDFDTTITHVNEVKYVVASNLTYYEKLVLELATGAKVTVRAPHEMQYQIADGVVMDYADFLAVITQSGFVQEQGQATSQLVTPYHVPFLDVLSLSNITSSFAEGTDVGAITLADITLHEPDFTLTVNDDRFEIVKGVAGHVLQTKSEADFDFETEQSLDLQITASDQHGRSRIYEFDLAVTNVFELPQARIFGGASKVDEGYYKDQTATGITVFLDTKPEGRDVVFTISGDSRFTITQTGSVEIKAGSYFDYEASITKHIPVIIQLSDVTQPEAYIRFEQNIRLENVSDEKIIIGESLGYVQLKAGEAFRFEIPENAFFHDDEASLATDFSFVGGQPSWITRNGDVLTGTPTSDDLKRYEVTVTKSKSATDEASQTLILGPAIVVSALDNHSFITEGDHAGGRHVGNMNLQEEGSLTASLTGTHADFFDVSIEGTILSISYKSNVTTDTVEIGTYYDLRLIVQDKDESLRQVEITNLNIFQARSGANQSQNVQGTAGDDHLIGTPAVNDLSGLGGDDLIEGLASDDILRGGDGDDILDGGAGADTIDGGSGIDTLTYANSAESIIINLTVAADSDGFISVDSNMANSHAKGDRLAGIENIIGSAYNDIIYGSDDDNRLAGGGGDDWLIGGQGHDVLEGGAGQDVLRGENGRDKASYVNSQAAIYVNLSGSTDSEGYLTGTGSVRGGHADGDKLSSVEDIEGSAHGDHIIGNGQDNYLTGGAGDDVLEGYKGNDRLWGDAGDDTLYGGSDHDRLYGGSGNDVLEGHSGNDYLDAGSGDDILEGFSGTDIIDGGEGQDTLRYSASAAGITLNLSGTLDGDGYISSSQFILGGDAQGDKIRNIEHLVGSNHNDILTGSDGANTIQAQGGNDIIVGTKGADVIDGGAGEDTMNYTLSDSAVTVNLSGVADSDGYLTGGTILSGGYAADDKIKNIEHISGSQYNDVLTGNDGVNQLSGGLGNDTLSGGAGDDRLYGWTGDDKIIGGAGADTIDGGEGNDTISYQTSNSGVKIHLGQTPDSDGYVSGATAFAGGHATGDRVKNIENVIGSDYSDEITGDTNDNVIEGGGSTDIIFASHGDDTLRGGDGSDSLYGGRGDDTIDGGAGNDLIYGHADNDVINGGDGRDALYGGAGDDVIQGGAEVDIFYGDDGYDIFEGGTGNDAYFYDNITTDEGYDTIIDFTSLEQLHIRGISKSLTSSVTSIVNSLQVNGNQVQISQNSHFTAPDSNRATETNDASIFDTIFYYESDGQTEYLLILEDYTSLAPANLIVL